MYAHEHISLAFQKTAPGEPNCLDRFVWDGLLSGGEPCVNHRILILFYFTIAEAYFFSFEHCIQFV